MACLNITDGQFFTAAPDAPNWQHGDVTVMTPAGVTIVNDPNAAFPGLRVSKGASSQFFAKSPLAVIHFLTFGMPKNFILVLIVNGTTRSVMLVNTTGPTILTQPLLTIDAPSMVNLPDVQPCRGSGSVFLLAAGGGGDPANIHAAVYRSDNGAVLCTAVPFHPTGQVTGEARLNRLRILAGGAEKASVEQPRGHSKITPNLQNFPDAVLGAGVDPALASHVKQFTIRNDGTDCRVVTSISGIAPYSIVGTSQTLPATLDPGQMMTVDVRFAPTAIATFNFDLPVTFNDPNGDVKLHCHGKGRAPNLSASFAASVGFGIVPVGTSGARSSHHQQHRRGRVEHRAARGAGREQFPVGGVHGLNCRRRSTRRHPSRVHANVRWGAVEDPWLHEQRARKSAQRGARGDRLRSASADPGGGSAGTLHRVRRRAARFPDRATREGTQRRERPARFPCLRVRQRTFRFATRGRLGHRAVVEQDAGR